MPSRSEIEGWTVEHLEEAATHFTALKSDWTSRTATSYDAIERVDWRGDAREDALEQFRSIKAYGREIGEQAERISTLCTTAAGEISTAKQMAVREITDAEAAGFTVGEDLSVTYDSTGLSEAEAATKAADAAKHAGWIHSAALNLITADTDHARSISSAAIELGSMKPSMSLAEPRGTRSPGIQPASYGPKLSPAGDNPGPKQNGAGTPEHGRGDTPGRNGDKPGDKAGESKPDKPEHGRGDTPDREDGPGDENKSEKPTDKNEPSRVDTPSREDGGPHSGTPELGRNETPPVATPMPSQQPGAGVPMSPPSGLGGGGAPKVPSSPLSGLGSPGGAGATPVQPAAFDKPLQAAAGSLGNNVPAAGGFTPPPQPTAAPTNGAGPVAPMTPPPTAATQPPPTAAPAPAPAPAPAATGPTHTGTPMAGGGMMPPLMAGGGAGGMGSPATPMTSPAATPPPVAPPPAAAPAAAGGAAAGIVPSAMSRADKIRRANLDQTGNKEGRIAHDAQMLCAKLHAATRKWPDLQWVVAARKSDGLLVVANNIGAGWLPFTVRLPRLDSRLEAPAAHVFVHGDIPWEARQDWIGSPVKAVKMWSRMVDDDPVGLIACTQATADENAADMQSFDDERDVFWVSDAEIPPGDPGLSGFDRFTLVAGLERAEEVAQLNKAALVSLLPSAASTLEAGEQPSMPLLFNDIIMVNKDPVMMTQNRIGVWRTFCEAQAIAAEASLRAAADDAAAREAYGDYAYAQWNLAQLDGPRQESAA
ncbi:hypothetical protein [Mycolicibacterium fortuitum]